MITITKSEFNAIAYNADNRCIDKRLDSDWFVYKFVDNTSIAIKGNIIQIETSFSSVFLQVK